MRREGRRGERSNGGMNKGLREKKESAEKKRGAGFIQYLRPVFSTASCREKNLALQRGKKNNQLLLKGIYTHTHTKRRQEHTNKKRYTNAGTKKT